MAKDDFTKPTEITIYREDGSRAVEVNEDFEALVHDQHALEILLSILDTLGGAPVGEL